MLSFLSSFSMLKKLKWLVSAYTRNGRNVTAPYLVFSVMLICLEMEIFEKSFLVRGIKETSFWK